MSREHIVSMRLNEAERAYLQAHGGPSAVLREVVRQLISNAAASPVAPMPVTSTSGLAAVIWADGTFGNQWPASLTG